MHLGDLALTIGSFHSGKIITRILRERLFSILGWEPDEPAPVSPEAVGCGEISQRDAVQAEAVLTFLLSPVFRQDLASQMIISPSTRRVLIRIATTDGINLATPPSLS